MTESGFNRQPDVEFEDSTEIALEIPSKRFNFYKTRRYGLLQFVKRPNPEYAGDLLTLEALRKEFITGYSLSHPAIVRYTALEDDCLYEEYIDGKNLREMFDGNDPRLTDSRFVENIIRQLFEALDYIHTHGILHLDIKPENLMISRIGDSLKVIDFSCAESEVCDTTAGFTEEYKAPEQGTGTNNCFTDIYLAGQVVKSLTETAGCGRKWKKFVAKATSENPEDRFKSASEALQNLPQSKSAFLWKMGVAMGCVAAVITISILAFGHKEEPQEIVQTMGVETVRIETPVAMTPETVYAMAPEAPVAIPEVKPVEPSVSEKPVPDIEAKIEKEIDAYCSSCYKAKVYPVINDSASYEGGTKSRNFVQALNSGIKDARADCISYGEKMYVRYPEKRQFIEELVYRKLTDLNMKVSGMVIL